MIPIIAFLTSALLQDPAAVGSSEPPKQYTPISITMTEAPGYFRGVSVGIPENGEIHVRVEALEQTPTKKWSATAFISLANDDTTLAYYVNLSTDRDLQQQYVRARLVNKEPGEELSKYTHQELFPLSSAVNLRVKIDGNVVSSFVNDVLVETRELPFKPDYYDLGVSSGSYKMTVLEDEPPPAPTPDDAG